LKVLIVKLSSLGDVVHAMPAVQDISRAFPQARIDWVVERSFAPLVERCVGVNRVIACELRRWRQSPLSKPTRQAWHAFKTELQREHYDAVIDMQGLSKSAWVSWLALLSPSGKRYAMANQTEGSSYEAPTRWLADVAIKMAPHSHAVDRSRELCALALNYALPAAMTYGLQVASQPAPAFIQKGRASSHNAIVALVHGTSRADKQWPLAHWTDLGRRLTAQGYCVALTHGSDQEYQLATEIANDIPNAKILPRLALDALTDALAACVGVIGVDSGLSHIAVALDLPHVQIYNFDTAWRTGPMNPARQCSVFAQPTPSVQAVWQAWLEVSESVTVTGSSDESMVLPSA